MYKTINKKIKNLQGNDPVMEKKNFLAGMLYMGYIVVISSLFVKYLMFFNLNGLFTFITVALFLLSAMWICSVGLYSIIHILERD